MYDYYLGGHDNYQVDHQAAEQVLTTWPHARLAARVNRAYMRRSTRWLAAEAGITQFLDIGTGIPTVPNLHQVAQAADPRARIVYTDNDPIVLRYAEALMKGSPEGRTAYLQADVTSPQSILDASELHSTLDLDKPVALSCNALFHFIPDAVNPHAIVEVLLKALAPGSFLSLSHLTPDFAPEDVNRVVTIYRDRGIPLTDRTKEEIGRFYQGLDFVGPGLVAPHRWMPDGDGAAADADAADGNVSQYAGVARKP
jgi:SAM-dependent methyltransferase